MAKRRAMHIDASMPPWWYLVAPGGTWLLAAGDVYKVRASLRSHSMPQLKIESLLCAWKGITTWVRLGLDDSFGFKTCLLITWLKRLAVLCLTEAEYSSQGQGSHDVSYTSTNPYRVAPSLSFYVILVFCLRPLVQDCHKTKALSRRLGSILRCRSPGIVLDLSQGLSFRSNTSDTEFQVI